MLPSLAQTSNKPKCRAQQLSLSSMLIIVFWLSRRLKQKLRKKIDEGARFCQFIQFQCVWFANIIEKPSGVKRFRREYLRLSLLEDMIIEKVSQGITV